MTETMTNNNVKQKYKEIREMFTSIMKECYSTGRGVFAGNGDASNSAQFEYTASIMDDSVGFIWSGACDIRSKMQEYVSQNSAIARLISGVWGIAVLPIAAVAIAASTTCIAAVGAFAFTAGIIVEGVSLIHGAMQNGYNAMVKFSKDVLSKLFGKNNSTEPSKDVDDFNKGNKNPKELEGSNKNSNNKNFVETLQEEKSANQAIQNAK